MDTRHRVPIRGFAVTLDPGIGDVSDADVLIEGERIEYVGPRLDSTPDAEVIDASASIVIPGLVDGHRHTWEALPAVSPWTGRSPTTRDCGWSSPATTATCTRPT